MATVLTEPKSAEVTWISFPISKWERDESGDLIVRGVATDGTVDSDEQIVDPSWSGPALATWLQTGGNVRMSHDARRPVGKGLEVDIDRDGDGKHRVRSLVVDPLAQKLVEKGVLTAYSIGISRPVIRHDPAGKARGGVICGGEVVELSLVDRPSCKSAYLELAKADKSGAAEFTGKVFGADDFIAKAASEEDAPVTVDLPKSATITFSPSDLAKLLDHRRVAEERMAAKRQFDPDVGGGVDRDKIPAEDFAGRNRSFPIVTAADVDDALRSIGRAGPDNYDAATLRRNILRIARRKGFPVPASARDGDAGKAAKPGRKCKLCKGSGKIRDGGMTCPRCHGDGIRSPGEPDERGKSATAEGAPVTQDETAKSTPAPVPAPPAPPAVAKDDGGDEHEPVLHHDDGDDDDSDSDADAMDKAAVPPGKKPKVPCPKCKAKCKPGASFCGKCGCAMKADKAGKPTPGDGVTGAAAAAVEPVPEHREPDGPAIEALEHDAGLPTVPDASVKTAMRLAALGVPREQGALHDLLCPAYGEAAVKAAHPGADLSMVDEMAWQAKALEIAASAPLEEAMAAARIWETARTLKAVTPDLAADVMLEARKAFRDANPGPGSFPQPGELSAERFNRPYISAGHGAPSPDHGAPHHAPVQPGHISAADFHRDLITAGHAADSPENASPRPEPVPAPEVPGVPSRVFYSNVQRQNARQAMQSMHDHIAMTFPDLCPMHGPGRAGEPPSHARPVPVGAGMPVPHGAAKADGPDAAAAVKAAKKAARWQQAELLDRILKGEVGLEDARAALGIAPQAPPAAAAKTAVPSGTPPVAPAPGTVSPDVIKAAVTEATAPLMTRLDDQQKMLDAIANQPDPAVQAYRSAAFPALAKSSQSPEGPAGIPARAAHVQEQFVLDRIDTARNSTDPSVRLQAMWDLMGIHGLTGTGRT